MKTIRLCVAGILLVLVSLFCDYLSVTHPYVMILKYLGMAYGTVLLVYGILARHHHKHTFPILLYLVTAILIFFTIMTVDTYAFHALTVFPGMIRYALFSTYGIHFFIFALLGIAVFYGIEGEKPE